MTSSESVADNEAGGQEAGAFAPTRKQFVWRAMERDDLEAVYGIGEQVHPGFPERIEVFTERLRLYAPGCRVLEADGQMAGYVISHPWHPMRPPKLDSLLVAMPTSPATFYIHDLALMPVARGSGAGALAVSYLVAHAEAIGLADLSLVSVNASRPFWLRQGFEVIESRGLSLALQSYDDNDACFMMLRLPLTPEGEMSDIASRD